MDMGGGDDLMMIIMLNLGDLFLQLRLVVIVNH